MAFAKGRFIGRAACLAAGLLLATSALAFGATFTGTTGPDQITGTDENDQISSGFGNDTVNAGFGNDLVKTAAGADVVDAGTRSVDFTTNGFSCDRAFFTAVDDDVVYGGGGPDTLTGGCFNDDVFDHPTAYGDYDALYGQGGSDTIHVDDVVDGASDTADGGRGHDVCYGNADDAFLSCEEIHVVPY
jgi:Ca2+-binding RTX toxin-like protein